MLEVEAGAWDEIQCGSYAFMDADYAKNEWAAPLPRFEHALFVLSTVMSRPSPHDGHRRRRPQGFERGLGHAGRSGSATDCATRAPPTSTAGWRATPPALGEKLLLVPGHCDPTINLYDFHLPAMPDVEAFLEDARAIMRSGRLSEGPYVHRLEERLGSWLGDRPVVAVSNASDGLVAALVVLARPGCEVIIPGFTFYATWQAVVWAGMTPVIVDVTDDGLIDPDAVAAAITPQTGAILAVHLTGSLAPMRPLRMLADRNGLALIADAAHAIGAGDGDLATGSMGDAEVVSIGATKQVAAGEGGAVTVRDPDKVSGMRRFKLQGRQAGAMDVLGAGMNLRLAELTAALALRQLDGLSEQLARRRAIHERYATAVADLPLRLSGSGSGTTSAHKDQLVWPDDPADRARLRRALAEAGIETKRYYEVAIPDLTAFSGRVEFGGPQPRARRALVRDPDPRAADHGRHRPGHRGHRRLLPELVALTVRLGLARRDPDPHTESLLEAIALAAESINVRPAWLRRSEDQAEFDLVLAVGTPHYYPWLLDSPPASTRISWFGEPLPRGSKATARIRIPAGAR